MNTDTNTQSPIHRHTGTQTHRHTHKQAADNDYICQEQNTIVSAWLWRVVICPQPWMRARAYYIYMRPCAIMMTWGKKNIPLLLHGFEKWQMPNIVGQLVSAGTNSTWIFLSQFMKRVHTHIYSTQGISENGSGVAYLLLWMPGGLFHRQHHLPQVQAHCQNPWHRACHMIPLIQSWRIRELFVLCG